VVEGGGTRIFALGCKLDLRTVPRALGVVAIVLLSSTAPAAASELARGDEAWARRADGQVDGKAAPAPIRAAIGAYADAIAADPGNLEASWKLLRALWFSGRFATDDVDSRRRTYERATAESERAFALVAQRVGGAEGLARATPDELRARLGPDDAHNAARLYFWAAIDLGEWSEIEGLLAAIRAGVPSRLHEGAVRSLALDPDVEQGGALRLLSRLQAGVPYLPLLFDWVDRAQAVPLAERAVAHYPQHPWNAFVLGQAILDTAPERRAEGLSLLERTANLTPRPDHVVEDLGIRRAARERLQEEQRREPGG
jgi:hypothetical protein